MQQKSPTYKQIKENTLQAPSKKKKKIEAAT